MRRKVLILRSYRKKITFLKSCVAINLPFRINYSFSTKSNKEIEREIKSKSLRFARCFDRLRETMCKQNKVELVCDGFNCHIVEDRT
jgi:hypothetical protein